MSEFDKFFDTIYSMLQSGEFILRQTARKLEKEVIPNKIFNLGSDDKDFSEFYDLFFKSEETKEPNFMTVAYVDAFCKAVEVTEDNMQEILRWLQNHQATDNVQSHTDENDKVEVLAWSTVISGEPAAHIVKAGYYIIESFDGWEYDVYGKTSEDFHRNLTIIKD